MSHTRNYPHPDGETVFIYDSDGGGDLTIVQWLPSRRDNDRIVVPFDNVVAFVLDHLAGEQVRFLENADTDELRRHFTGRSA